MCLQADFAEMGRGSRPPVQQSGLATVLKLPVDVCSWPHLLVFKIVVYGLSTSLGSSFRVYKVIFTPNHPVNLESSGLLYQNRSGVEKEEHASCHVFMWARKMGRGRLNCLKYLESGNLYLKVLAGHQKGHVFCEFIGNILHLCVYIISWNASCSSLDSYTEFLQEMRWLWWWAHSCGGRCVKGLTGMFTRPGWVEWTIYLQTLQLYRQQCSWGFL